MESKEGVLRCSAGHSFDIARQGYVNVLSAQDKRSREPGDSQAMVAARHRFLEEGHYQPIADGIADLLAPHLRENAFVVDAGCGEGYYLQHLHGRIAAMGISHVSMMGFDISKWAMQVAARRFAATWLVASNRHIPLEDASVDIVIDMFGFPDFGSFARILKPSGLLLRVQAGENHLVELRRLIYPTLKSRESSDSAPAGFSSLLRSKVHVETLSLSRASLADLLLMTPHFFRASSEGKERVAVLDQLPVTVDVSLELFRYNPGGEA